MTIFASPDFGASGMIVLFLLIGWAIVFALVVCGILCGKRLQRSVTRKIRMLGTVLIVASAAVPFACHLLPPHAIRLIYGNYPIGKYPSHETIKNGMTTDEVLAILGSPHEHIKRTDNEDWYYWIDSYGISWFGVSFGPDSRVEHTYGN